MSISETYKIFKSKLCSVYDENEAEQITRLIFESIINITRSDILINPNNEISSLDDNKLQQCMEELLQHKPVQYVLGFCFFYKLLFKVNENVLIPRPETEELVSFIIDDLQVQNNKKILDIGTGSGCIAIGIKKNVPSAIITSVDISESALEVAQINANKNNTDVSFLCLDFLDHNKWNDLETFDIIVSNPPYIPEREYESINNNVKLFEPNSALFVPDPKPLIFYEKIAEFSELKLSEKGRIFLEIHQNFGREVCELFNSYHYNTEIKKDIYENDRFVIATRNH